MHIDIHIGLLLEGCQSIPFNYVEIELTYSITIKSHWDIPNVSIRVVHLGFSDLEILRFVILKIEKYEKKKFKKSFSWETRLFY